MAVRKYAPKGSERRKRQARKRLERILSKMAIAAGEKSSEVDKNRLAAAAFPTLPEKDKAAMLTHMIRDHRALLNVHRVRAVRNVSEDSRKNSKELIPKLERELRQLNNALRSVKRRIEKEENK